MNYLFIALGFVISYFIRKWVTKDESGTRFIIWICCFGWLSTAIAYLALGEDIVYGNMIIGHFANTLQFLIMMYNTPDVDTGKDPNFFSLATGICPHCRRKVKRLATVCPHCTQKLT